MPQLEYNLDHTAAAPGMIADKQSPIKRERLNTETAAGIAMGRAVSYGTAADGGIIGGTAFAGVSFRRSRPGNATTNAAEVAQYEPVETLQIGTVWVTVSGAVTHASAVAYNATTGIFTAGPAGVGEQNVVNAQFRSAAGDGEIAKVQLFDLSTTAGS